MKRSDIRGFTIKFFGYHIEIVTIYHIPATLAIYKNNNRELVKRFSVYL